MPLSRDSRTEKKLKAIRRAEFRLKQQLEYIDWSEDELFPEIEALKAGRPVLGLEAGAVFDIQVDHAHSDRAARHSTVSLATAPAQPASAKSHRRKPSRTGARLRPRK